MWKKLLSILTGVKNPKPAYALVPKQQPNSRLPRKKMN